MRMRGVGPLRIPMDLSRPALGAPVPADLAPHPGAEAVQVACPAAGMALHGDRHGVEQFAVTAATAFDPEPIALAGEVGYHFETNASHAPAVQQAVPVGNGRPEQSGNKSVECAGLIFGSNARFEPRSGGCGGRIPRRLSKHR